MRRVNLIGSLLVGLVAVLALPHAAADFTQPDAYAVVIGISQYREEVIPKVAYAVKDAEAVAKLLEIQAGIPKSHIRFMPDAKATIGDLRTIGDWLRMRVKKPESTVYVYYAGHGTPDPKTGAAYLVPWDGHPDFPTGLYPLNELYSALNALPSKNILVLLDACFSGAAGRSVLGKGARPMALTVENPVLASGKLVVLAASSGTQISSDYDKAGHGLFTYALLTGLHGAADQDHDGLVTVRELYPYVRKQVAETAVEELNREQTPVLLPSEELLGARAALPVALVTPGAPAKPSMPALGLPPVKDVDVSGYDQLDQVEKLAEKREQVWAKVQQFAGQKHVKRDTRLAMLDKFLADFPDDNPHAGEVEALKQQIAAEMQVASVPSYSTPKEAGREITGQDGAPMVLIPAGSFWMGSTEDEVERLVDECQRAGPKEDQCRGLFKPELPRHQVTLDAFYLDVYEVTNRLFEQFVNAAGYETTAENEGKASAYVQDDKWTEVNGANWRKPEGGETVFVSNRDEHPVVSVSWYDAEAYCRWAGKRLPTEAEFEYATRAGTSTTYWWGDGNPGSRRVANIADETNRRTFPGRPWPIMNGYNDGYARTAPVGSFEPNPWGLHDMIGNALEWTADWYDQAYYQQSPSRNPAGPSSGQYKVLRGGSWGSRPQYVRSAPRFLNTPTKRDDYLGFRCAKTP